MVSEYLHLEQTTIKPVLENVIIKSTLFRPGSFIIRRMACKNRRIH